MVAFAVTDKLRAERAPLIAKDTPLAAEPPPLTCASSPYEGVPAVLLVKIGASELEFCGVPVGLVQANKDPTERPMTSPKVIIFIDCIKSFFNLFFNYFWLFIYWWRLTIIIY